MHAWEPIQITIDYIEEHISEKLEIEELAKLASLSVFYYQRLFKRLVKKPVMEYIRLRRMAIALDELTKSKRKILDIALDLGFNSHEQFTRTFKETFGITPEKYRNEPLALNYMTKPELLLKYVMVDEDVPIITNGIVLEINRIQLPAKEYFHGFTKECSLQLLAGFGVESGEDPLYYLWETLHERKNSLPDIIKDSDEIGVTFSSENEGYFNYFAGAQVKALAVGEETAKEISSWTLDEGEYIVCSFEAESFDDLVMDVLYKAQNYLFDTWLKNKKIAIEPFEIERYKNHNKDTTSMEIWVKVSK